MQFFNVISDSLKKAKKNWQSSVYNSDKYFRGFPRTLGKAVFPKKKKKTWGKVRAYNAVGG